MTFLQQLQQLSVLCVQDISCVGRCSLTVALPAISAMGISACPLPTSLLSSHFLSFSPVVHNSQTRFCNETLAAYKQQDITFSAVITGYLGNAAKADMAKTAIDQNQNALVLVDPVLADHGKLYKNSTKKMCAAMQKLCASAHILTPNVTESAVLLNLPPSDDIFSSQEILTRLEQLASTYRNAKHIVITGVRLQNSKTVNAVISKVSGGKHSINLLEYETLPKSYPGTGDLFASILVGRMLTSNNICESINVASQFITKAIKHTIKLNTPVKYGVCFEPFLHTLYNC